MTSRKRCQQDQSITNQLLLLLFTWYYAFVQEHSQIILPNVWLSLFTGFNPNWLRVALLQPGNHCPKSLHPWSRWVCLDINEKQYWTDTNNSTDTCLKIFSISIEKTSSYLWVISVFWIATMLNNLNTNSCEILSW